MTTTAGWTEAKGSGNKATLWGGWTTYPAMEGDNTAGGNRWTEAKGSGNKATLWGGWTTYPAMEGDNTGGGNRSRTRGR
jgi:hypothetical protein